MAFDDLEETVTGRHVILGNISVNNLDSKVVKPIGNKKFRCVRAVVKSSETSIIIYLEIFEDVKGFPENEQNTNITAKQILEYIGTGIH